MLTTKELLTGFNARKTRKVILIGVIHSLNRTRVWNKISDHGNPFSINWKIFLKYGPIPGSFSFLFSFFFILQVQFQISTMQIEKALTVWLGFEQGAAEW